MDLEKLREANIITKETFDWLLPLWLQELEDRRQFRDSRAQNLFTRNNDDGGGEEEEEEDLEEDSLVMTRETIRDLQGVTLAFWMDNGSTGHGNRVWHSSVAMCLYLKHYSYVVLDNDGQLNSTPFRSLELGAGTALPSLYLGHILSTKSAATAVPYQPLIHITDGKQYRNIRQILVSLSKQPSSVLDGASFRVSPHNWGEGLDAEDSNSFLACECSRIGSKKDGDKGPPHTYDLILVSDCIYNPQYHHDLMKTIAATLRLPQDDSSDNGGKAILSFSLHGNTPDQDIWNFLDHVVPQTRKEKWQLTAHPIQKEVIKSSSVTPRPQPVEDRYGWDMEETMKDLGLWTAHMEPKRWFSFLYEIRWTTPTT
jgi:Lysine methyltransferase